MREHHLNAVLAIDALVIPTPWPRALYLSELGPQPELRYDWLTTARAARQIDLSRPLPSARRTYVVADRQGEVVGYGGTMFAAGEAHLTTLSVAPDRQRQGIGRRLLLHLVRDARARGATDITLAMRVGNSAAGALYREFGFGRAGTRAAYYSESGEDAVVMWAADVDSDAYAALLDDIARRVGEAVGDP